MNLEDLIINEDSSVLNAMQQLDKTGRRIVFVAPGGVLKAVLTDSDVRKFILRGGEVKQPLRVAANYNPKSLPVEKRPKAKEFLLQNSIDAVPLLDKQGVMVDIVFANDLDGIDTKKQLTLPVVIMAGGLGTRLYPYTKILPKPLIPVGEVPILELIMERFNGFGCADFRVIVNYRRNMIKSYFNETEREYDIEYIDEDEPLGTGGGLCLLKGKLAETFFLTNCDVLIEADYADIIRFHKKSGNAVTMICAMKHFVIPYGVVEMDADGCFGRIAEKPEMDYLTNTGMYVVEPSVVEAIEDGVSQGFTDIIEQTRAAGGRIGVYPISEASWMDMGQLEELEKMRRRMEQA
ncbi:NTP transferase domain-containing protein [Ruminococcaceae bacterium OttesenSCG-928-A16]|nr:NTP transferase domain-containing protein [Ruminococcaceae bacterium OttesenSCG-928-A16]